MPAEDTQTQSTLANARTLLRQGQLQEAEAACRQAVDAETTPTAEATALLGLILLRAGGQQEGRSCIEAVAEVEPNSAAWASDLGAGLYFAGDTQRARTVLERSVKLPNPPAPAFNNLATVRLAQGELEGAEAAFREALLREPDHAGIHSNLGTVMMRQDNPEAALRHYERALALDPNQEKAVVGHARALHALDRPAEAVARLEQAIATEPDSVVLVRRLARLLALQERYQEAEERLSEAMERAPDDVLLALELAALFTIQVRHDAAHAVLSRAADREPENTVVLAELAQTCSELGANRRAAEFIETVIELEPEAMGALVVRARININASNHQDAETDLRRVLERHPGAGEAWGLLGHVLMSTGRMDEAVGCFERAAELNPLALAGLVEARALPDDPAVVDRMAGLAGNRLIPAEVRAAMSYALIKVFEKRGDFVEAFAHAGRANAIQRRTIDHDAAAQSALVDRIIETFTPELFDRHFGEGWADEQRPVFVCGMPRSGTTLTEQVLASHPDVFGAGELEIIPSIIHKMPSVLHTDQPYPACMAEFRKRTAIHAGGSYLKNIRRLDDTASYVVDKLPHNFLHLGLIALIFPRARIVHICRDPRDVALSIYFTNFKHKRGLSYAFDLAEIGHMINDHERIMAHWRKVLPVPIYDLHYEELVADQEGTTRQLLDFIGLDWDDRVLDFHETERAVRTASVWQVRQPIYKTSRERWRGYAEFLDPLNDVLARPQVAAAE